MSEKYDVTVIGSGSGGSEAALLAAEKGSTTILIEKDAFGGTRLHRGSYAVRALRASSRVLRQVSQSRQFGIETGQIRSSLMNWMKAQRAATSRLAEELRTGLQTVNVRIASGAGRPERDGYPIFTKPGGTKTSPDLVLVATGRLPNIEMLGLAQIGIAVNPFILVDSQLRTNRSHIFAIGDVNGLNMLDSSASAQAQIAVEAIHGGETLFNSRWVPRYLDTEPPVAAVGWMETDAIEAGVDLEVSSDIVQLVTSEDRTVAEPSRTQVKLIVESSTKKIQGCVVVGNGAAEVINLAALAIQSGVTAPDLERLLVVHPSVSVALQRCAKNLKKGRRPHLKACAVANERKL